MTVLQISLILGGDGKMNGINVSFKHIPIDAYKTFQ